MFNLGLAIFLLSLVIGVALLGGQVSNFIDLPTLLLFVLPLFAVLLATRSLRTFIDGLRAVVNPREPCTEELRGAAASLFRFLSRITALLCGLLVLIPLINMLMGLDFADAGGARALAINLAATMMTPLYGLFLIAGVFEPAVFILKKRKGA